MSISVLFPIVALALGVLVSVYLFVDWLRHGRRPRFLLCWALALFLMYWFQVPVILTNLGKVITVTDFNFFFALTLPVTFLALMLIFLGVVEFIGLRLRTGTKIALFLWFLSSVLFFAYQFILNEGIIKTYAMPLAGNLAFYLPLRIVIIAVLVRWLFGPAPKALFEVIGVCRIMGESALGIVRNLLVLETILAYPPEFWYLALTELRIFFILQTFSVIAVALGFFFFHRIHYRARNHAVDSKSEERG